MNFSDLSTLLFYTKVIALDNTSPYVANSKRRIVSTVCGTAKDKVMKANGYGKVRLSLKVVETTYEH